MRSILYKKCECGHRLGIRDASGAFVKAPSKVRRAVADCPQKCRMCGRIFPPGQLLSDKDREWLEDRAKKPNAAKRIVRCSICGETGHTKAVCEGRFDPDAHDREQGGSASNFDEERDDNGISNEDWGLCPHGASDDEGCDVEGCCGGPDSEHWENY